MQKAKFNILIVLIAVFMIAMPIVEAKGEVQIYDSSSNSQALGFNAGSHRHNSASFTANETYYISFFALNIYKNGVPTTENYEVRIYNADAYGLPTGSPLTVSNKVLMSSLSASPTYGWKNATFNNTAKLTSGTRYAILLYSSGASATIYATHSNMNVGTQLTHNVTDSNDTVTYSKYPYYANSTFGMKLYGSSTPYTFRAKYVNGTYINTFNITYNGIVKTTTNGTIKFEETELHNATNYNMTAVTTSYISLPTEINITHPIFYDFTVYKKNTVQIYFRDEVTNNLIVTNPSAITVRTSGTSFYQVNTTKNGSLFINTLNPMSYVIQYNATNSSANWGNKYYYIDVSSNSPPLTTNLYLTKETTVQATFTVLDPYGSPVKDATVKLLRHVPTYSSFVQVTMGKTDEAGNSVLPIVQSTVIYMVYIEYNGILMNVPQAIPLSGTAYQFQIDLNAITARDITFISGVSSLLSNDFRNGSRFNVTHTFSDSTNTITAGCVRAYQVVNGFYTLLNYSCTTSPSGSAKVVVYKSSGKFYTVGSIVYGGSEIKLSEQSFELYQDTSMKTKDVLFVVMFIIFTLGVLGFIISPPFGFIMLGIGLIIMAVITVMSWYVAMPFAIIMFLLAVVIGNYQSR